MYCGSVRVFFSRFSVLFLIIILSACNENSASDPAGGLPGTGTQTPTDPSGYTVLAVDGAAISSTIQQGAYTYYSFQAQTGQTYTINLQTTVGDADLNIYTSDPANGALVSDSSNNGGIGLDSVTIVSAVASTYYVEVNGYQSSDYNLSVVGGAPAVNNMPVASAGSDQSVSPGNTVTLDGSGSYDSDSDPLTYSWTQTSGTSVTLSNATAVQPTFTAPMVNDTLVFSLVVNDGTQDSYGNTVYITVANLPPAISGFSLSPGTAYTNTNLTLSYSASDPETDPLTETITWLKNGSVLPGHTTTTLASNNFIKGDTITVQVDVSDGINATVTQSTQITIQDSAPVLNVSGPSSAPYNSPVSFIVNATDADNDPIQYSLGYAPDEMSINASTGAVSWTPNGPMFDVDQAYQWKITATAGGVTVSSPGSTTITDASRNQPIVRTAHIVPSTTGLSASGDIDGDTKTELVYGNIYTLYSLEFDGSNYVQDWVYPFALNSGNTITSVAINDVDNDGTLDILVGFEKGLSTDPTPNLYIIDGVTKKVKSVIAMASSTYGIKSIHVSDVDQDGTKEIVFIAYDSSTTNKQVMVYDATTLAQEWASSTADYGLDLAVGNLDADAYPEIVSAAGYVFAYNGTGYTTKWANTSAFGYQVEIGDTDNNGVGEIIALGNFVVNDYLLSTQSILWSISSFDAGTVKLANIDADPEDEVILGGAQGGSVWSYSYNSASSTISSDWSIAEQGLGAANLIVDDVDNDTNPEFVWVTNSNTTSVPRFMVVAGLNPGIGIEWSDSPGTRCENNFYGATWSTVAAAQTKALFVCETNNGEGMVSLDASGNTAMGTYASDTANQPGITSYDYDSDGIDELLMTKFDLLSSTSSLMLYDFAANTVESTVSTFSGLGRMTELYDFNGDSKKDYVLITNSGTVTIYDSVTLSALWDSGYVGSNLASVVFADLEGDGSTEIIILGANILALYDSSTGSYAQRASVSLSSGIDLLVKDIDGDGIKEIITASGTSTGNISVYDPNLNVLASHSLTMRISSIYTNTLTGNSNIIVANYDLWGSIAPYYSWIEPISGTEVTRSPDLLGKVFTQSMNIIDVDGNGTNEMLFGTSRAMYMTQ